MRKLLIRNFCLIAHVDHGKSTLADRFLEITHTIAARDMKQQFLDSMTLERERGITIKLNGIQLQYRARDQKTYTLNLIDTPGHIDFSYEVVRSLTACEGVILLIDGTQGIQAQTLANAQLAWQHQLTIIPVINKIDLPTVRIQHLTHQITTVLPFITTKPYLISAKTGERVAALLQAVVDHVQGPVNNDTQPLRALIFDSYHDRYRGVVLLVRIIDGIVKPRDQIQLMSNQRCYQVVELGVQVGYNRQQPQLTSGEVGWLTANIRNLTDVRPGDTITSADRPAAQALPGYQPAQPVVFCHLFPADTKLYSQLHLTVRKLSLSDAAISFHPVVSAVLGAGLSCGFLGLLHMEVVQQRLQREYGLQLITTAPSVNYEVHLTNGKVQTINNPDQWPAVNNIRQVSEPWVKLTIFTPATYTGGLMKLCQQHRGVFKHLQAVDSQQQILCYELPLAVIIFDFFNQVKAVSQGFATFQYDLIGNRPSHIVKLEVWLNRQAAAGLARLVHASAVNTVARQLCEQLKTALPRHNFAIPIQAVVNHKVVARETLSALRKHVTAGLYGGDITRKKKVLARQKQGKKRLQQCGKVVIPPSTYARLLKLQS